MTLQSTSELAIFCQYSMFWQYKSLTLVLMDRPKHIMLTKGQMIPLRRLRSSSRKYCPGLLFSLRIICKIMRVLIQNLAPSCLAKKSQGCLTASKQFYRPKQINNEKVFLISELMASLNNGNKPAWSEDKVCGSLCSSAPGLFACHVFE